MPVLLVVGTINRYPAPGPDWDVIHVDASTRGIWDADVGQQVPIDVVADMRDLPFPDESVDRIQCWHTLEHVNEQGGRDAVAEFARVLRPGGVLDIRVPDMEYVRTIPVRDALPMIYGDQAMMPDADLNVHRWGYTRRSLRGLVDDFGFLVSEKKPRQADEIHFRCHLP